MTRPIFEDIDSQVPGGLHALIRQLRTGTPKASWDAVAMAVSEAAGRPVSREWCRQQWKEAS